MVDEEPICRICLTGEEENHPVMKPCKCRGTMQNVHEDCLIDWLRFTKRSSCEICKFDYKLKVRFEPNCSKLLVGCFSVLEFPYRFAKFLSDYFLTMLSITMWILTPCCAMKFLELCSNRDFVDKSTHLGALIEYIKIGHPILGSLISMFYYAIMTTIKSTTGGKRRKLKKAFRAICRFGVRHIKYLAPLYGLIGIFFALTIGYIPLYIGQFLSTKLRLTEITAINAEMQVLPKILVGQSLLLLLIYLMQRIFQLLPWSWLSATMEFIHTMMKVIFILLFQYLLMPMLCGFWFNICLSPVLSENIKYIISWNKEEPVYAMLAHFFMGVFYLYSMTIIKNEFSIILHPKLSTFFNKFNIKIWFNVKINNLPFLNYSMLILYVILLNAVTIMLQFLIPMFILRTNGLFEFKWYQYDFSLRFAIWIALYVNDRILFKAWFYFVFTTVGLKQYLIPIEKLKTLRSVEQHFAIEIHDLEVQILLPNRVEQAPDVSDIPAKGIFYLIPRCCALVALSLICITSVIFMALLLDSCICFLFASMVDNLPHLIVAASCIAFFYYASAPGNETLKYFINVLVKLSILLNGLLYIVICYKSLLVATYAFIFGDRPVLTELTILSLIMMELLIIPCIIFGPKTKLQHAIFRMKNDGLENTSVKFIVLEIFTPILKHIGLTISVPLILMEVVVPNLLNNFYLEVKLSHYIYVMNFIVQTHAIIYFYMKWLIHWLKIYYNRVKIEHFSNEICLANFDELSGNLEDQHILPLNLLPEDVFNKIFKP